MDEGLPPPGDEKERESNLPFSRSFSKRKKKKKGKNTDSPGATNLIPSESENPYSLFPTQSQSHCRETEGVTNVQLDEAFKTLTCAQSGKTLEDTLNDAIARLFNTSGEYSHKSDKSDRNVFGPHRDEKTLSKTLSETKLSPLASSPRSLLGSCLDSSPPSSNIDLSVSSFRPDSGRASGPSTGVVSKTGKRSSKRHLKFSEADQSSIRGVQSSDISVAGASNFGQTSIQRSSEYDFKERCRNKVLDWKMEDEVSRAAILDLVKHTSVSELRKIYCFSPLFIQDQEREDTMEDERNTSTAYFDTSQTEPVRNPEHFEEEEKHTMQNAKGVMKKFLFNLFKETLRGYDPPSNISNFKEYESPKGKKSRSKTSSKTSPSLTISSPRSLIGSGSVLSPHRSNISPSVSSFRLDSSGTQDPSIGVTSKTEKRTSKRHLKFSEAVQSSDTAVAGASSIEQTPMQQSLETPRDEIKAKCRDNVRDWGWDGILNAVMLDLISRTSNDVLKNMDCFSQLFIEDEESEETVDNEKNASTYMPQNVESPTSNFSKSFFSLNSGMVPEPETMPQSIRVESPEIVMPENEPPSESGRFITMSPSRRRFPHLSSVKFQISQEVSDNLRSEETFGRPDHSHNNHCNGCNSRISPSKCNTCIKRKILVESGRESRSPAKCSRQSEYTHSSPIRDELSSEAPDNWRLDQFSLSPERSNRSYFLGYDRTLHPQLHSAPLHSDQNFMSHDHSRNYHKCLNCGNSNFSPSKCKPCILKEIFESLVNHYELNPNQGGDELNITPPSQPGSLNVSFSSNPSQPGSLNVSFSSPPHRSHHGSPISPNESSSAYSPELSRQCYYCNTPFCNKDIGYYRFDREGKNVIVRLACSYCGTELEKREQGGNKVRKMPFTAAITLIKQILKKFQPKYSYDFTKDRKPKQSSCGWKDIQLCDSQYNLNKDIVGTTRREERSSQGATYTSPQRTTTYTSPQRTTTYTSPQRTTTYTSPQRTTTYTSPQRTMYTSPQRTTYPLQQGAAYSSTQAAALSSLEGVAFSPSHGSAFSPQRKLDFSPQRQKEVFSPTSQRAVVSPTSQRLVVSPTSQRLVVSPTSQRLVVSPTSQRLVVSPTSQRLVVSPTSQRVVVSPTSQRVVVSPTSQRVVVSPTSQGMVVSPHSQGMVVSPHPQGMVVSPHPQGMVVSPHSQGIVVSPHSQGMVVSPHSQGMVVSPRSQRMVVSPQQQREVFSPQPQRAVASSMEGRPSETLGRFPPVTPGTRGPLMSGAQGPSFPQTQSPQLETSIPPKKHSGKKKKKR